AVDRRDPGRADAVDRRDRGRIVPGTAVAVLQFSRPGQDGPLVHGGPLYVVEGTSVPALRQGPGHYVGTALPGQLGNFAVAGHRTTYGAPFYHLDDLRSGDEVLVTDRNGRRYTYRVRTQEVVAPGDSWVTGPDPLETGRPTLTLTTCNPRFSAAQRLIVFAELDS
nr:class E sortase [Euzebyales bacterium]